MGPLSRSGCLLGICLLSGISLQAQSSGDSDEISIWDTTFNVQGGGGYKENVLLSSINSQGSPFVRGGVEMMVFRLPIDGRQFYLFFTGEHYQYLGDVDVEKEQTVVTVAQYNQELTERWTAGIGLQYFYQDQVFDVSTTEAEFTTLQLQGHNIEATPSLQYSFAEHYELELGVPAGRQFLARPLDDYNEIGLELTLERDWGRQTTASLGYSYTHRFYDTRPQRDPDGFTLEDTSLRFHQNEFELKLRHYWDENRRWRTDSRLSFELNKDNGSGYFDYKRYRLSQRARYKRDSWQVEARLQLSHYEYDVRTVSFSDPELWDRTSLGANFRLEKDLTESLMLFTEYDYENVISNRRTTEYEAHVGSAGLDWQF